MSPVCLGSVAGSVIQATGRTDFEDGPRIGNQCEAGNSLQRVHTIPENKGIIVLRRRGGPGSSGGRRKSNLQSSAQSVVLTYSCYCGVRI